MSSSNRIGKSPPSANRRPSISPSASPASKQQNNTNNNSLQNISSTSPTTTTTNNNNFGAARPTPTNAELRGGISFLDDNNNNNNNNNSKNETDLDALLGSPQTNLNKSNNLTAYNNLVVAQKRSGGSFSGKGGNPSLGASTSGAFAPNMSLVDPLNGDRVVVAVRVRPLNEAEIKRGDTSIVTMSSRKKLVYVEGRQHVSVRSHSLELLQEFDPGSRRATVHVAGRRLQRDRSPAS